MTDTRNNGGSAVTMPTLMVASITTGFALTETTISKMQEAISVATGLDIFTHEMGHGPTMERVSSYLHERFPGLPSKEECNADWRAAANKAVAAYGETMTFEPGNLERQSHPMATLDAMLATRSSSKEA